MKVLEKKYLLPFILVTSLFALWGLANNMTDTLLGKQSFRSGRDILKFR